MRKYHMSGVEHVHMMRHVPRSYDMTRTHIMHQGVNKHVDVVLRSSPKHWKTKKVRVNIVKSEKKSNVIRIRAHANKGYVAVRKVTNEKYEADRRKVVTAYETKYAAPSANNRALIHDLKSQLSAMAKRSADYIDSQLGSSRLTVPYAQRKPQPSPAAKPKTEAPLPEFPKLPDEPVSATMLSPETEAILKKGGYKRPKPLSSTNPYASDYSRQTSDWEFRSLMASLERSPDEACNKYVVDEPNQAVPDEGGNVDQPANDYSPSADFSLNITEQNEIYAQPIPPTEPSAYPEDMDSFEPALDFSAGGEHYLPEDELFDRDFSALDDSFTLPTVPQEEPQSDFDASRFFSEDEEEFIPPQTDYDGSNDFALPTDYAEEEQVVLPQGYSDYEEAPVSFNPYPEEEEEAYVPPTIFPEEEEDLAPPTVFPEDEEDFVPPTIFPEEEEYVPMPQYPEDDGGYSPAPVSPDRNEYWEDGDYATTVQPTDARQTETFFSRTGGQLKKAIGVIRGRGGSSSGKNRSHNTNNDVEITYSDSNN